METIANTYDDIITRSYEEYYQVILTYITYRITHRYEAEDLTQDVAVYLLLLIITTDIVDYNIAGNSEQKIFHCVGTEHLFLVQQTYKYILGWSSAS